MKKTIALTLLFSLFGCNNENNEQLQISVEQELLLPGGAKVTFKERTFKDEITYLNGKKIRKISFKTTANNANSAEQSFYKILQEKNYSRRVTDIGKHTIRVFYSVANETGIDSYFIKPTEQKNANGEVHVILAWPTK